MKEKIYILNKNAQYVGKSEEEIIIHVKNKDKYYSFPDEISYMLLSFNGIRTVEQIIDDTSEYFGIKRAIIEAFINYYIEKLINNGVIVENYEYYKAQQSR
ncbi:hypothetical protein [Oceanobacillus luteolus]|uniref:PqqD family protein n=1 Tax=Oceanobacillus luteolus TaxID=1274358 RepID=A0ABW4HVK1_9BACI